MSSIADSVTYPEFKPRAPWLGPDLQTLRNMIRGPALPTFHESATTHLTLPLSDGTGDQLSARFSPPDPDRARTDAPLVVLVHGLGGSEDSSYMHVTTRHLHSLGYPVLRLSLRGAGPSRALCRGQYHAGRTADLRDALAALSSGDTPAQSPALLPTSGGVVAVGYSLGGNMLLKFAAEFGGLRGAVSVSAPIDLSAASHRILATRNRVYQGYLLNRIKEEALASTDGLSDEERACIPELQTILDFDNDFIAPHNGFVDAADYYAQNNARQFLAEIAFPTLLLHACDDPWIPVRTYQEYPWHKNRNLQCLLPPSGGHVGFHSTGSRVPWHDQCIEAFLQHI